MIEDWWKGYHPVSYKGRGVQYYLGNNRGIVHSFVDSNNVINGQTYYYAVVAYDHGDSLGIPPTETTKKITYDPITSQYTFDVNTVQVIPGPRSAGYIPPGFSNLGINHESGISTGNVQVEVMNDMFIQEEINYKLTFKDTVYTKPTNIAAKNYSILRETPITDVFELYDTNFTKLSNHNLLKDSYLVVKDESGETYQENADYIIDYNRGLIRRTGTSRMLTTKKYNITYRYYPIYQSQNLNYEDSNPIFDGIRFKTKDMPAIAIDTIKTSWIKGKTNFKVTAQLASIGTLGRNKINYPADYEVSFSSENVDSAVTLVGSKNIKIPVKYSVKNVTTGIPQPILTFLKETIRDSAWSPGEEIIFFKPGSPGTTSDTTTWGVIITKPSDTSLIPVYPTTGDVLLVATMRPFTKDDVYSFKTHAAKFDANAAKSRLDNVYVVPNPYVGMNEIEPTTKLPGQSRGERRIYFENLPPQCTIRIYTIAGELVQTLEHSTSIENGREYWNLLNKDGFSVAYGVYLAHIDAPGVGEKLIKFALIK